MEVIIYSVNSERSILLKRLTDDIIVRKRLRQMSLHTSSPSDADELISLIRPDRGYLVIVDAADCGGWDWKESVMRISSNMRRVKFFIISASAEDAACAVNISPDICAFALCCPEEDFPERYEEELVRLYRRVSTICGGIMTYGSDGALKVIKYSDIYYIETIKQQHKCTVYHQEGTDIMRADISKLICSLDGRFEKTRSSTIANLSLAKGIRDGNIYFTDKVYCSVTAKRAGTIKKIMRENCII